MQGRLAVELPRPGDVAAGVLQAGHVAVDLGHYYYYYLYYYCYDSRWYDDYYNEVTNITIIITVTITTVISCRPWRWPPDRRIATFPCPVCWRRAAGWHARATGGPGQANYDIYMYIYIYIYIYTCILIYIHTYVHVYEYVEI